LTESIKKAILKNGFSFIEVLAPCPINYGRRNREKAMDTLKLYQDRTLIRNNVDPGDLAIDFSSRVVLGEFVDTERSTCIENYDRTCRPQ